MAESAAHLVDDVFPQEGVRQWVLSFPMPLRFILAQNSGMQARCLTIVHRAITAYLQKKAARQGLRAPLQPGVVTLIQRFGGSLNLNVHYHMLFLEGGYYQTRRDPKFWRSGPPSDDEIQVLVVTIAKRVIRFLKKKGYFQDDVDSAVPEKEMLQETLLPELQAASIQSRIALGERKGHNVRRLGAIDFTHLHPERKGRLCAQVAGFSLHAAVYCKPLERRRLEMLCRYITRPAVAEERLELQPSGDVLLRLKTPYSDGTTHLGFSGPEFVETATRPAVSATRQTDPTVVCRAPTVWRNRRSATLCSWERGHTPLTNWRYGSHPGASRDQGGLQTSGDRPPDVWRTILTCLGLPSKPPDLSPARSPPQISFLEES